MEKNRPAPIDATFFAAGRPVKAFYRSAESKSSSSEGRNMVDLKIKTAFKEGSRDDR